MRQHAQYDDEHPKIALEIVQRYATTDALRTRAMIAAKRSLELLDNALITAYRAYSQAQPVKARDMERRKGEAVIAFPDRRFEQRRVPAARTLHVAASAH